MHPCDHGGGERCVCVGVCVVGGWGWGGSQHHRAKQDKTPPFFDTPRKSSGEHHDLRKILFARTWGVVVC
jgi:hypothetical protein